jgi:hypothetical protein
MVNHSETYKDLITSAHINTVEGSWRIAKAQIPHLWTYHSFAGVSF